MVDAGIWGIMSGSCRREDGALRLRFFLYAPATVRSSAQVGGPCIPMVRVSVELDLPAKVGFTGLGERNMS